MSIYTKHPLLSDQPHIRLMRITPGSSSHEINCTISTFDINTAPNYHALSYEWGPKSPSELIYVMGQPTEIRSNLFNFLSRLKARASHDYLWCDSICIDQANDYERSHQVQLMNRIYRKAQSVLVWLGEARENSDFTLRTIRLLSTCTDKESRAAYLVDRPTVWQGLVDLSRRRYWTRIWIVQEITVARDAELFCGSEVIPWSTFASACRPTLYHDTLWSQDLWTRLAGHEVVGDDDKKTKIICATDELYWSTMNRLHSSTMAGLIRSQRRWPTDKESFMTLYERYKDSGCEDDRDRIFALLGISTEVTSKCGYTADYLKSKEKTFFSLVAWAGKGAVKMDSRLHFARMTAEAMNLTWPHHLLESSLESESQRSSSFFNWVHQPLEMSLRCYKLGVWSFHRQLDTTGAAIFRSDSRGNELYLSSDATEHDVQRDLHIFEFETSKVLLACQVAGERSWTVVGRAYYADQETRCRQRVPSVFRGLKIATEGASGSEVQLQNLAQFMEIFLEDRKSTLHQQGKQIEFGCPRAAGSLRSVKESENRELEELLGRRRIKGLVNLDWFEGGRGSFDMMDDDSLAADLDKLMSTLDLLARSRVPSTSVEKRRQRDGVSSSYLSPDVLVLSGQPPAGQSLEAPRRYSGFG